MDTDYTKALLEAVKSDDNRLFVRLVEERKGLLSLCFGRIPLLSLIYLYRSNKIAAIAEKTLININSFNYAEEDPEAYRLFIRVAKRALRLYVFGKSIVTPLEMLAILGDSEHLAETYAKREREVKTDDNIALIYKMLHGQSVNYNNGKIVLRRLALPKVAKIAMTALAAFACLIIALAGAAWGTADIVFGSGEEYNPVKIFSEAQLAEAIGSGERYYALERDITLNETWQREDFSGTLLGNGHTVFVKDKMTAGFIATLSGRIESVNFVFGDSELTLIEDTAFLVHTNNGIINNVKVYLNAEISINGESETLFVSGIVKENNREIINCVFEGAINIEGNGVTDAYLCGIASLNNGTIIDCSVTDSSRLITDTADVAGITVENGELGIISGCSNYAEVKQRTERLWYPLAAGIVLRNYGTVSECCNYGSIIVEAGFSSEEEREAYVAGIASVNNNIVENCINRGNVFVQTASFVPYGGGIVGINNARIYHCKNEGGIFAESESFLLYAGGVASVNNTYTAVIDNCCAYGTIEASAPESGNVFVFAGGIVGYLYGTIKDSYGVAEFDCSGENAYIGGIAGVTLSNNVVSDNNYYVDRTNIAFGLGSILVIGWDNSTVIYNGVDENTERVNIDDVVGLEVYWG